jgi:hypothetical protein
VAVTVTPRLSLGVLPQRGSRLEVLRSCQEAEQLHEIIEDADGQYDDPYFKVTIAREKSWLIAQNRLGL